MNSLPTGMFLPGNSPLHRLDAGAKLLILLMMLAAIVEADTLPGYLLVLCAAFAATLLSRLKLWAALGSVYRLRWFFLIILFMNTCFFSDNNAWTSLWIFHPSTDGLLQGLGVVFRVVVAMVLANVLTCTTSPMELTFAMERLISPLRYLAIPTQQIALIISVAIQFIPTLFEETEMIRKAQTARGAKFDSPKLLDKAGAIIPLVIPIFLSAFKRADDLSMAMEARGYRSSKRRAKKRAARLGISSYIWLLAAACVCIIQFIFF